MALRTLPNPAFHPTAARADLLTMADQARLRRYGEYLAFYNGSHWARTRPGRTNLVVNYARTIVDKGVSYLLGRGLNFSVVAGSGSGDGREARAVGAEELLYRVYEENDLEAVDAQAATNGAVLGDTVFKVYWDAAEARVRVVNQDPMRFFCSWTEDDLSKPRRAHSVYLLAREEAERRYGGTFRGAAAPSPVGAGPAGAGVPVCESWSAETVEVWAGDRLVVSEPNPYGFIPFVHIPNCRPANEFWGVSDLRDLIPINRELNERFSDMADVIRFHSDPPVVFKGVSEHTSMSVGPGTIWDVPEDADVSLLEWRGSQPAAFEHIDRIMRALHDVAETPKTAFGEAGRLQSGVALEVELLSLIQKTMRKRAWWSGGLRRRCQMVLRIAELMGAASFGPMRVRVVWPQLLPGDQEADVRNNVALVQAGLRSRRTAMDRLGEESPEAEMERIRAEGPAVVDRASGDGRLG